MDNRIYKGLLVIGVFFILTGSVFAVDWCPAPCSNWFCPDGWFCNCATNDCGGGCCGFCDFYDFVGGIPCGGFCIDPAIEECCWKGSCDLTGGCPHSSDREVAINISHYSCCNFNSIWLWGHKPDADWKCTTATVFDNTEIMDGISGAIYSHTNSRGDVGNALTCWSKAAGARVCGDDACYNINTQQCWAGGDVRSEDGGPCVNGSTDCVSGICCAGTCVAVGWDVDGDGHISDQCIGDIPGGRGDDCNDNDGDIHTGHAEICDCKDNDCDGLTDAADSADIEVGPMCTPLGVCIGHQKLCVDTIPGPGCAAAWVDCDAPGYSNPETGWGNCDGKDNDCDGLTDADDPDLGAGPPCTNLGVCIGHNKLCAGGVWIDCDAPGYENPEVSCDGEDNDCNGQWDEPCDCDDAKPTCELAPPRKDCRDALCIGTPGNSCWSVGGEIAATTCCGDDLGEFYKYYDQHEADGCNDVINESCVAKDDDTSDHACCNSVMDCVLGGVCYPNNHLIDIDGDGIDGEYCRFVGGTGKWDDCDSGGGACEGICHFKWINGGEAVPFGEYDTGTELECCGDDPREFYVGGTDGTYACCDNMDTPGGVSLAFDECVIGGVCQNRIKMPEVCNDNEDNDCDGKKDCDDEDCAGQIGPNGKICCPNGVVDCVALFDDCKIESCIAHECSTTDRPKCAQAECGLGEYCDSAGGDCVDVDDNSPSGKTVCEDCAGYIWIANPLSFEMGTGHCCGDDANEVYSDFTATGGGIGCCAPGVVSVTPAGVCIRCALGYPCEGCNDWVTATLPRGPCIAPALDGCVRDSGVGYYDWACCEGIICKIERKEHL